MNAIKIELLMEDMPNTEYFITHVLPELKVKYKINRVVWSSCKYFGGVDNGKKKFG